MITSARRTFGVTAMASLLVAGLVGCAGAVPEGEASDVALRVIVYTSNPDQLAMLDELAEGFMAENPAVTKVTFESIAAADLDTKLTAELQTSDAPDASWMTVVNSKRYIEAGALLDLAPTLKADEAFDYDDLIAPLQSAWVVGDAQYGVPFSTSTQVLYYNADMFRAAGQPTPDEMIEAGDWNWDSFREAAAAISASQGVPGYAPPFDNVELLYPLMYAYEASPWNESGAVCTANSAQMKAAMTTLHGMMYTDGSSTLPGQSAAVFDGSAATSIAYLSSIPLLKDAAFEWGVVPTPAGPNGAHPTVGQSAFVAFEKSKNPELAAKLVAYLTNAESSKRLAAYWVPSRDSLLTPAKLAEGQPLLTEEQFAPIVEGTIESGKIVPVSANGGAAQSAFLSALNEFLFTPEADVAAALDSVCEQLTPALESR